MHVAICQPHYLPWLGYFEMIDRVDCFVFLDHVDFCKRGWQNRNRIRKDGNADSPKWLSVPIEKSSQRRGAPASIAAARLDARDWRGTQLASIRQVYSRAPNFERVFPILEELLEDAPETLGVLNRKLILGLNALLGIDTPCISSSTLPVSGTKTQLLSSVLSCVGATRYLANNGSSVYLDGSVFDEQGVVWAYQDYTHPVYPQSFAGTTLPWLSHLSIVDALMNVEGDLLTLIRSGRPAHTQEDRYAG